MPVGQVHCPEAWPLAVWGVHAPLEQVTPHWPQLAGSFARSLQTVPQQTAPGWAPLHALWLQLGSWQSMRVSPSLSTPSVQLVSQLPAQLESAQSVLPSQSLSMPSAQRDSVAGTGNTPLQAQVVPEQVSRLLLPEQLLPAQSAESLQSKSVSPSLSAASLQVLS